MENTKEKLHPITVWCMYVRYFNSNFLKDINKFRSMLVGLNTEKLDNPEVIECILKANEIFDRKSIDKIKEQIEKVKKQAEYIPQRKIKTKIEIKHEELCKKDDILRNLHEELKNLREKGLSYFSEKVVTKIEKREKKLYKKAKKLIKNK
jgi:hypothetical protein